jgi:hypothetical protein
VLSACHAQGLPRSSELPMLPGKAFKTWEAVHASLKKLQRSIFSQLRALPTKFMLEVEPMHGRLRHDKEVEARLSHARAMLDLVPAESLPQVS